MQILDANGNVCGENDVSIQRFDIFQFKDILEVFYGHYDKDKDKFYALLLPDEDLEKIKIGTKKYVILSDCDILVNLNKIKYDEIIDIVSKFIFSVFVNDEVIFNKDEKFIIIKN